MSVKKLPGSGTGMRGTRHLTASQGRWCRTYGPDAGKEPWEKAASRDVAQQHGSPRRLVLGALQLKEP